MALAPFALAFLAWLAYSGTLEFGGDLGTDLLLILAGPITAVPLMFFALAARRLRLSTVGLTQFIAPSLHFILAVVVYGEAFSAVHAFAFGFIWLGLFIFSTDSIRRDRRQRRMVQS